MTQMRYKDQVKFVSLIEKGKIVVQNGYVYTLRRGDYILNKVRWSNSGYPYTDLKGIRGMKWCWLDWANVLRRFGAIGEGYSLDRYNNKKGDIRMENITIQRTDPVYRRKEKAINEIYDMALMGEPTDTESISKKYDLPRSVAKDVRIKAGRRLDWGIAP